MDAFSSSPTMETFPDDRFGSPSESPSISPIPSPTKTEVDADFPVEMDESFNSSMTFGFNDSPPHPAPGLFLGKAPVLPQSPSPLFRFPRRNTVTSKSYSGLGSSAKDASNAPPMPSRRALGPSRTFGQDITNNNTSGPNRQLFGGVTTKGMMPPPSFIDISPKNATAVSPVPLKSTLSQDNMDTPHHFMMMPRMGRRESAPAIQSPARSKGSDMMDVDTPARCLPGAQASPSVSDSPGIGQFFEESPAPAIVGTKRGFALSSPPGSPSSSPSTRRRGHDRSTSTSGLIFGGVRANPVASRRVPPYKRPPLQPLAPVNGGPMSRSSAVSAYPIMNGPRTVRNPSLPAMRRTLSLVNPHDASDDESDMDASPSVNATNAEYQRRYGRVADDATVDGSPGFKPIRTAIPRIPCEIKTAGIAVQSSCGPGGMFHYGADERQNKILPCHTVREDGLVRITAQTMCELLCGRYGDKISRYHIFDCRFDYEYDGGHIQGAVNVRNNSHLDELLLTACSGVNDGALPTPSVSGEMAADQRVVIIFHCEFSVKRAPTFAKEFRSRDRALNLPPVYPKLHYPEVYILEGGYKGFFENAPTHCHPQAYVRMDDPKHTKRCDSEYADFSSRHFGRTRSYTFGDSQTCTNRLMPPITLAAASAALGRRGSRATRTTITEETEPDSSPIPNASPTPRAVSMGQAPLLFGSIRPRTLERSVLQRYASDAMVRL